MTRAPRSAPELVDALKLSRNCRFLPLTVAGEVRFRAERRRRSLHWHRLSLRFCRCRRRQGGTDQPHPAPARGRSRRTRSSRLDGRRFRSWRHMKASSGEAARHLAGSAQPPCEPPPEPLRRRVGRVTAPLVASARTPFPSRGDLASSFEACCDFSSGCGEVFLEERR